MEYFRVKMFVILLLVSILITNKVYIGLLESHLSEFLELKIW